MIWWSFFGGVVVGVLGVILVAGLIGLAGHSRIAPYMEWYMARHRAKRVRPQLNGRFKRRAP